MAFLAIYTSKVLAPCNTFKKKKNYRRKSRMKCGQKKCVAFYTFKSRISTTVHHRRNQVLISVNYQLITPQRACYLSDAHIPVKLLEMVVVIRREQSVTSTFLFAVSLISSPSMSLNLPKGYHNPTGQDQCGIPSKTKIIKDETLLGQILKGQFSSSPYVSHPHFHQPNIIKENTRNAMCVFCDTKVRPFASKFQMKNCDSS